MRHYWYYKPDIILSKTDKFQCECQFGNKASCEWRHQLLWHVRVPSAGTRYFSENYSKAMFSFH